MSQGLRKIRSRSRKRSGLPELSTMTKPLNKVNTQTTALSMSAICRTCGSSCCKPLLQEPIYHINIGLEAYSFIEHDRCAVVSSSGNYINGVPSLSLLPHIMGYCPFLNYSTNNCSIYDQPYRPQACHSFPFTQAENPILNANCLYKQKTSRKRFKVVANHSIKAIKDQFPSSLITEKKMVQLISTYWINHDEIVLNRNRSILTPNHGAYYIIHPTQNLIHERFFSFVKRYAHTLNQTELFVNVLILNNKFQEIDQIVGAFSPHRSITVKDIPSFNSKDNLSKNKKGSFQSNALIGVCFEDELKHPPSYWNECFRIIKTLIHSKKEK